MLRTKLSRIRVLVGVLVFVATFAHAGDRYHSFAELLLGEGPESFRITLKRRSSPLTVIAPHAGSIEVGTSWIARHLALEAHSLYLFEGSSEHPDPARLHVTSHRFDEPQAVRLMTESVLGISVHQMRDRAELPELCVGGASPLRDAFLLRLKSLLPNFSVGSCARFRGAHSRNIVNLASRGGIQLEFSTRLVRRLEKDPGILRPLQTVIGELSCELRLK